MRYIVVFSILFATGAQLFAQEQEEGSSTKQGNVLLEVGISPFLGDQFGKAPSTGFSLLSFDGETLWSVGGEGGYFVVDDLALKGGLGYTNFAGTSFVSYKAGVKYYIASVLPLQIDISGATGGIFDLDGGNSPRPLYLGLQGGYVFFINESIAFEPSLRYNFSLNEDFSDEGILELRVGFVILL